LPHQCHHAARARRRALLRLAAERGFVIVEDDYEFEMSFKGATSPR
jgi:GntR family transcriptional regulator/MocR family aminotransferase